MESSRKIYANYPHAEQLVKQFPNEAIDLIAQTCELQEIVDSITLACQKFGRNPYEPLSPKSEYKSFGSSPTDSQQSVSPPSVPRYPLRRPQQSRPALPPSPARTSSSSISPLSKSRTEYIIIVADGPEDDLEHKLSMRQAPVNFSVISQDVVRTRLHDGVSIKEIPQGSISLQHPGVSGSVLLSSEQVTLTWRRPPSRRTHETSFYLVSNEIDVDILLGHTDPAEGTYLAETLSPHPKRPVQGPVITAMHLPAPEAPQNRQLTPSRHSSSLVYGSNGTTPVQEIVSPFLGRAHGSGAAASAGYGGGQQPSPTPTQIHRSRPSSSEDPHLPHQTSTATSTPLTSAHQQPPYPDEIAVECTWDMTSTIISIDLNATSEHMFNTMERIFRRGFKKKLDRHTHFIRFTPGEHAGNVAERVLFLDEATLTKNWSPTANWMMQNSKTDSPHLYAFIELDEG